MSLTAKDRARIAETLVGIAATLDYEIAVSEISRYQSETEAMWRARRAWRRANLADHGEAALAEALALAPRHPNAASRKAARERYEADAKFWRKSAEYWDNEVKDEAATIRAA